MFKALVFSCTSTDIEEIMKKIKGGSRATATSKMERFVIKVNFYHKALPAVNYYHKAIHLGCCSSPRSASVDYSFWARLILAFIFCM